MMNTGTHANTSPMPLAASGMPVSEDIETRFGKVKLNPAGAVAFPQGVLGFPDKNHYCLTEFPSQKFRQFKLLQSLDDAALSFITLPVEKINPIVNEADILAGCQELQMSPQNLALLLIVSVHRMPEVVRLSVNARAPIFVDTATRVGAQHVFRSDAYHVQHFITA